MPKPEHFDVAVLGAGPAGCAAARVLGGESHRSVALIDWFPARPPSAPLRPGETLPPGSRPLLERLGLWERFSRADHLPSPGVVSAWGRPEPAETDFLFHPYGCGWNLDRPAFGHMLRDAAEEAGARLMMGVRLLAAERCHGGSWELMLDAPPGPSRLRARLIIVATGRALPAALPLPTPARDRILLDRLVGIAAISTPDPGEENAGDHRLFLETAPGGWWYAVPLAGSGGMRSLVFLTDADLVRAAGGPSAAWHNAFAEAPLVRSLAGSSAIQVASTSIPAQSYCRRTVAAANFILIGDAACAWDPLTGRGIHRALEEGCDAALAAAARLDGATVGSLRSYARRARESWRAYVRQRADVYGTELRWESQPFWRRRHSQGPS